MTAKAIVASIGTVANAFGFGFGEATRACDGSRSRPSFLIP